MVILGQMRGKFKVRLCPVLDEGQSESVSTLHSFANREASHCNRGISATRSADAPMHIRHGQMMARWSCPRDSRKHQLRIDANGGKAEGGTVEDRYVLHRFGLLVSARH